MSFGKKDTDDVYDNLIKKALRQLKITPIRIDRKQHNNDIDDEMLVELNKCDLIISDLTYARPSVYFEAGFGVGYSHAAPEKAKPVIFTCRKDHLSGKNDDEYGNFKIHFDLQMKNVISWRNNKDTVFLNKLINRIKFVITPLLKNIQLNEKENKLTQKFKNLATAEKSNLIYETGITLSKKSKYKGLSIERGHPYYAEHDATNAELNIHYPRNYSYKLKDNLLIPLWVGTKFEQNVRKTIYFHVDNAITKTILNYFNTTLFTNPIYDIIPKIKNKPVKKYVEALIFASFKKTHENLIQNNLHEFSYNNNSKKHSLEKTLCVPSRNVLNWKKIFYRSTEYGSHFDAYYGKDREGRPLIVQYRITNNFMSYSQKNSYKSKSLKLKNIPRMIDIYIISDIQHEKQFAEELESILKSI